MKLKIDTTLMFACLLQGWSLNIRTGSKRKQLTWLSSKLRNELTNISETPFMYLIFSKPYTNRNVKMTTCQTIARVARSCQRTQVLTEDSVQARNLVNCCDNKTVSLYLFTKTLLQYLTPSETINCHFYISICLWMKRFRYD